MDAYIIISYIWLLNDPYKSFQGTFSIVLLALTTAHLRFTAIEVGAFGHASDGGIFSSSALGKGIVSNDKRFGLPGRSVQLESN